MDVTDEAWEEHNRKLAVNNTDLLLALEKHFIIKEYHLGTDPYVYYEGTLNGVETSRTMTLLKGVEDNLSKYKTENVLFGCYRSEEQLNWILKRNLYNVRYTKNRAGTVFGHNQQIFTASYLMLYNYERPRDPARCFVLSTRHILLDHDGMIKLDYPFGEHAKETDWYFVYRLEGQVEGAVNVEDILKDHHEAADGSPLYLHYAEVDHITRANSPKEGGHFWFFFFDFNE